MSTKKPLSRSEVALLLGCTREAIFAHHGKRLTPVKNDKGQWEYDRDQVERLATVLVARGRKRGPKPKDPGALAREVFRMFRLGIDHVQIVDSLAIEPERVRALYTEFQTSLGQTPKVPEPTIEQQIALAKIELDRQRLEFDQEKHRDRPRRKREVIS